MSINVINWVLDESATELGSRLVMLALAESANPDGGGAYPSVATIQRRSRLRSRSGVQRILRRLEADGHIANEGKSPKGTSSYRLIGPFNDEDTGGSRGAPPAHQVSPPGGRKQRQEGGASDDEGGAHSEAQGAHSSAPEPSLEPSNEPKTESPTPRARASTEEIPPELARVVACLQRVVEAKGAKPLRVGSVVKACREFLAKQPPWNADDLGEEAEEFEEYWVHGEGENVHRADVAATWRKRLRTRPSAPARRARGSRGEERRQRVHSLMDRAREQEAREAARG